MIPDSYPTTFSHVAGAPIELTAIPAPGYAFIKWGGDITGDSESTTLSPTCDTAVTAVFASTQSAFAWWWLAGIAATGIMLLAYLRITRRTSIPDDSSM